MGYHSGLLSSDFLQLPSSSELDTLDHLSLSNLMISLFDNKVCYSILAPLL